MSVVLITCEYHRNLCFVALGMCELATFVKDSHIVGVLI
jgi:hypothetical protein